MKFALLRHAIALFALLTASIAAADEPGIGPGWQCVTYARQVSAVQIRGDAWSWWETAAGRYDRGSRPAVGAVMVLRPHGQMSLGHVAKVSRIVGPRRILLDHANWSGPGLVEHDVLARDVSPRNDWSEVRVWYAPIGGLGTTDYPVYGFIYPSADRAPRTQQFAGRIARPDEAEREVELARSATNPDRDVIGDLIATLE